VHGRHRQLVGIGRLAAVAVGHAGPQRLASVIEAVDDLDAARRQRAELLVELGQLHP
jgi:hypothetical protein